MSTKTICEVCGKEYEYDENNIKIREEGKKRSYDSSKFCCYKCAMKFILDKQKKTLSEKYGKDISNPFHIPGVQDKARATSLERYGTEFGVCSEQSVKKRRATCKKKYGVEFALQNKEIKQKTYDSNVENHGGVYHLHTKEVMQKRAEGHRTPEYREKARQMFDVEYRKQRCLELFGVDNVFKLKEYQDKGKQTCIEKYGAPNPLQNKGVSEKMSTTKFLKQAINKEDINREYFVEHFINSDGLFDLDTCAKYYNISLGAAEFFKSQFNIKNENVTVVNETLESEFYQFISTLTDKEILRHDRKAISPLELDVYIPDMKLAFEFNGDYWHSANRGVSNTYHLHKTQVCESNGIRLIHIWEHEWLSDQEKIKIFIRSLFVKRKRIRASKCEIKLIPSIQMFHFAEKYHLLGSTSAPLKLGLYYKNELVSALGLFKSKDDTWDLKRYIVGEYQVMGGFEKLFKYFIEQYKPKKIITFVENSKFLGTVNFRNGFVLDKELPPDFFWVINDKRVDKRTAWRNFREEGMSTAEYQAFMMTFALKCYDAGKKRLVWESR